jgi:DNA polymerase III subunit alpha
MMRCIVWPEEFANYSELIKADGIVALRGVIDKRPGSEEANFIVNEVITLPDLATRFTRGVMIRVDEQPHGVRGLEQLYEILRGYPGNCELQLALRLADGSQVTCTCDGLRVELNGEMRSRVEDLLGQGSLRPVASRPKPTNNGNNGNGQRGYSRQPAGARS